METKTCAKCKKEFPKTTEFFFKKKYKQKLKNGNISIYYSFRSICKICNGKQGTVNQHKRRCIELNCSEEDRVKRRWEEYSKNRIKYPEIKHLSEGVQNVLRKKIDNGYIFTTYEQYKIDCRSNVSKVRRKYDHGDVDFFEENNEVKDESKQ
jgi:hypothetical protein